MTTHHHAFDVETYTVDEFFVRVNSHTDRAGNWGGVYGTYEEARREGITRLISVDTLTDGAGATMEIVKRTRMATDEEIQAEKDSQVQEFDWKAQAVQITQDMATVTGASDLLKGQTGDLRSEDPVSYTPEVSEADTPGPFSEYQRGYVAGVNSFSNILKGR